MISIVHGKGSDSTKVWIPWLKAKLKSEGFKVNALNMPSKFKPKPKQWEKTLEKSLKQTKGNTYVGHSTGTQTILHHLPYSKNPKSIFLVAPFQQINYETVYSEAIRLLKEAIPYGDENLRENLANKSVENSKLWCDIKLPWEELKQYQTKMHLFFSTNDYYVNPDQIDLFQKHLPDATYNIVKNAGHFTTTEGYKKFPLLLETMLKELNK